MILRVRGDGRFFPSMLTEHHEAAGLDTMNFHLAFGNISNQNVARCAELFAAEVMPAFAEVGVR